MGEKWKAAAEDLNIGQSRGDSGGGTQDRERCSTYQITAWQPLKIVGGVLFACWWIFLAYMVFSSRKDGLVSHIAAYGFLAYGLVVVICVLARLKCERFLVRGETITLYHVFAPPSTHHIHSITKVVVCKRARDFTEFRIYMGKKKIATLHDGMVNCDLFLAALREHHVPFKSGIV